MARPLGRVREMPEGPVMAALAHVHDSSFYGARMRFHGTRLVATDLDWSAGEGRGAGRRATCSFWRRGG
ncbi:hypothetical protein [Nonomuraea dietziae]|uniref:hypothetical protein n=1 Tax=Nonomuraea dietziae TaxID=65515 RepID=UPI00342785C0